MEIQPVLVSAAFRIVPCFLLAGPLAAVPVTVPNGSFEFPATAGAVDFPNDAAGVTGAWESSGLGFRGVFRPGVFPGGPGCAPTGLHGLNAGTISDAGIFQDAAPFNGTGNSDLYWQGGKTYTLTVGLSLRPDTTAPQSGRTLGLRFYYRTADQAGANVLANKTITAGTAQVNNWEITEQILTYTVPFGAPEVGKPIGLWFPAMGGYGDWTIDNVRLDKAGSGDLDNDQLPDSWELARFILPGEDPVADFDAILARQTGSGDSDLDGATNIQEYVANSSPADTDSDDDGLTDGTELNRMVNAVAAPTKPTNPDTDGDTISDGAEVLRLVNGVSAPTNPLKTDTDNDGLSDLVETDTRIFLSPSNTGSNPLATDTDGDTYADRLEVVRGSNPNIASSIAPAYALLARWSMNENAGQTVPATANPGLSGTFGSATGVASTPSWAPGTGIGGSLLLNANTDRVDVPAPDLTYGFTVMGWIKPTALPTTPWARFLANQFNTGFYLGRNDQTSQWKFIVNGSAGPSTMQGGSIVAGHWQHVCGTYDGTTARLYVNGILVGSQGVAAPSAPIQPLFFGSENAVDRCIPGSIDEIKVYSGAMPAAQISQLQASELPYFGSESGYGNWLTAAGVDPLGSNASRANDFDGDGTNNGVEYVLKLTPNSGVSRFAVIPTGDPATGLTLSWPSQPGITFTVRSSADMTDWSFVEATVPAAASPAAATSWNTGPLAPGSVKKFYRVEFNP